MNRKLYPFYTSVFFQHLAYGLLIPILIIWQHQKGLSFAEIGLVQSIGFVLTLVSEVPSSYFADHIGKKSSAIMGLTFVLGSFIILISASDFFSFALFQSLLSIGLAFLSGTEEALLHDMVQKDESRLTRYLGIMSISDELGTIMGMLISSVSIATIGTASSFKIGLVSISMALLALLFVKTPIKQTDSSNPKSLSYKNITIGLILFLFAFACMAERGQMLFQNRLDDFGVSLGNFGLIYVFAKMFSIAGSGASHYLEEKIKSNFSFLLSATLQIVAFSLMLSLSKWLVIIALGIFFFSENLFRNIQRSVILKNVPQQQRATALSLTSFSSSIFLVIAQPILGLALDTHLIYAVGMVVGLKIMASLIFLLRARS